MAWIRQLPSGLWAATVRLRPGPRGRVTETHRLKSVVKQWAEDLERDVRHGTAIDPRDGRMTVGEMWELARKSRRLSKASRKRDDSHWRCHVAPRWASEPIGPITRPDIKAWVVDMEDAGVGSATIQGAVGVLRAILATAVDARKIRDNPAEGVTAPPRDAHLDRVLDPAEDEQLLAALDRVTRGPCPACGQLLLPVDSLMPEHRRHRQPCLGVGGPIGERPWGRLFAEMMRYCGLRWEEVGAIDRDHVRMRDALLDIGPVVERDGSIRPTPKSRAGIRTVPVPDHLWPQVRARALATPPGGLLFPAPDGRVINYSNWYHRIWTPALRGLAERPAARGRAYQPAVAGAELVDPQPTPHDLRHTLGTELAEQGVQPHEIMALLGHESLKSVERYIHARESRFARARRAIRRARDGGGRSKAAQLPRARDS